MPRTERAMVIGFYGDTIHLQGGGDTQQRLSFNVKNHTFHDFGEEYFSYSARGYGQSYAQLNHSLYFTDEPGDYIYAFDLEAGQTGPFRSELGGDLQSYDQSRHCIASISRDDGYLIVTGGEGYSDGIELTTLILDLGTNSWTQGPDMNEGRYNHACMTNADETTLYVFGGLLGDKLDSVERMFDVSSMASASWSYIDARLEIPMYSMRAIRVGTDILLIGGVDDADDAVAAISVLDTESNALSISGSLDTGLYRTAAIYVQGTVYVFGGNSDQTTVDTWRSLVIETPSPTSAPTTASPTSATAAETSSAVQFGGFFAVSCVVWSMMEAI